MLSNINKKQKQFPEMINELSSKFKYSSLEQCEKLVKFRCLRILCVCVCMCVCVCERGWGEGRGPDLGLCLRGVINFVGEATVKINLSPYLKKGLHQKK